MRQRFCWVLLALMAVQVSCFPRVRRQAELSESNNLTPLDDESLEDPSEREKRMLEGVTQAKYGVKNAILGFVFGKINQLIDSKTRLIDRLDKMNIAQNKMYGIEPPGSPVASLGNVVTSLISPKINLVSGLLGNLSGGGSSSGSSTGSGGGGIANFLNIFSSLSSSSSGRGASGQDASDSESSDDDDDDDKDDDDN